MLKTLSIIILFAIPVAAISQICSGSLGDPVGNYTFSTGGALKANSTSYTYTPEACPRDGFYTIVSSTTRCFADTWHEVSEDHTPGDLNGYMMLVNASADPGIFYVDTIKGLCGKTTYEFAAWVMNVLKPTACGGNALLPRLTFTIETLDGIVLGGPYSTGDIPASNTPDWKQYGLFFNTPEAVSDVIIRVINNNTGGCGNDVIFDDITFRPCGPGISAGIVSNAGGLVNVCEDDPAVFVLNAAVSSGYANPSLQWQQSVDGGSTWTDIAGAQTASFTRLPTIPGNYQYRIAAAEAENITLSRCKVASNVLTIIVNSKPDIQTEIRSPACIGTTITLKASGGTRYSWEGPSGFRSGEQNPPLEVTAASAGSYQLTVTTQAGCVDATTIELLTIPQPIVSAGSDVSICEGTTAALLATGGVRYQWLPSAGLSSSVVSNPLASPSDTTRYKVVITDGNECSDTALVTVNIWKKPRAIAGADQYLFEGDTVQLNGSASGTDITFFWTPEVPVNAVTPRVHPGSNTTYTLHVESERGCTAATDEVFVRVYKKLTIPNAFSPNSDGINDNWQIINLDTYPDSRIVVFNRYGQQVYAAAGYSGAWNGSNNGKPLPAGTYYYIIDLKISRPVLTGWVFIAR
ncbi:MAG: gliding motility-associated C-terminal domain-containing protein [Chitinophagaceae bacterium]|nr:gliding motility-associated C-terminal domain-containing protein [Chitinophagaceae bacterium]